MVKTYKFSSREKRLIIFLALLIALRIFHVIVSPYVNEYINKSTHLKKANEELIFYRQRYEEISSLSKDKKNNFFNAERSILYYAEELPSFLLVLEELAVKLGVKIISIETEDAMLIQTSEPELTSSEAIESLPLILSAVGNATSLQEFVNRVENLQRAFEIQQVEFKKNREISNTDQEIWVVNLAINIYFRSSI